VKERILFMVSVAILLLSIACLFVSRLCQAPTSPTPTLFVDPSNIVYNSLVKGTRFSISITVVNVTDLKGYELKLSFNSAMLSVLGVTFLPLDNLPDGNCKVASGTAWINVTYDSSITTNQPLTLVNMTLQIKDYGTSPLHLYDTTFVNSGGSLIPLQTADGLVSVLLHDVAIVEVDSSTNETYVGDSVNVTVVAKNCGNVAENFTVSVYHNDTLFGSFDLVNLGPSQNATITFEWNTSDVIAGYAYPIKAQASLVPYEANTTNNVLVDGEVKVKIIGDVNNDNVVNINDLIAWDAAYGSRPGQPNWNPQADINGDGVVDKADGVLIVENYLNTP
jgi:hypothetical protein